MPLHLYNTLTRRKEAFEPIDPSNVRMYVCGPTVYDFAHIGNARPVIVFDVLYRLLRHIYGPDHVTYVRNITDLDDKINARALRDFPDLPLNEAIRKVTETTASQFFADVKKLGCLEPTEQPRATDNIRQMIAMIETLIARGHAYVAAGEVLFAVDSMPDYGALSQRRLEDQQAGARVAVEAHKRNPADFVLWKLSSPEEPGWESPWGRGRPGWHIECSAMSSRYLGEVFDIHGGGLDLIFPHHENEIAQSRCAFGTNVMAKVWMHNGFLQVEGQKMSKSLGNFVTINDALREWRGDVVRYAMLMTHYTQPTDWTRAKLVEASRNIQKFQAWYVQDKGDYWAEFDRSAPDAGVFAALKDDLNTPEAFTLLHKLTGQLADPVKNLEYDHNRRISEFSRSLELLGLTPSVSANALDRTALDKLIAARLEARKAKNWAESDRIRDELAAMGIAIKDNKDGTTSWEVKR